MALLFFGKKGIQARVFISVRIGLVDVTCRIHRLFAILGLGYTRYSIAVVSLLHAKITEDVASLC